MQNLLDSEYIKRINNFLNKCIYKIKNHPVCLHALIYILMKETRMLYNYIINLTYCIFTMSRFLVTILMLSFDNSCYQKAGDIRNNILSATNKTYSKITFF